MSTQIPLAELQSNWGAVLQTNLFGVTNIGQAFAPYMAQQENPSVIINTGSKQGITCPPYVPIYAFETMADEQWKRWLQSFQSWSQSFHRAE
jgi:NAD(P)-dependent dehydrogenase (short-subunit alcohol dehydrogenase family)